MSYATHGVDWPIWVVLAFTLVVLLVNLLG
jgi:hypothetical protein